MHAFDAVYGSGISPKRQPYSHFDENGRAKAYYPTRRQARRVARQAMLEHRGLKLREYGCGSCDGFHLTKAISFGPTV